MITVLIVCLFLSCFCFIFFIYYYYFSTMCCFKLFMITLCSVRWPWVSWKAPFKLNYYYYRGDTLGDNRKWRRDADWLIRLPLCILTFWIPLWILFWILFWIPLWIPFWIPFCGLKCHLNIATHGAWRSGLQSRGRYSFSIWIKELKEFDKMLLYFYCYNLCKFNWGLHCHFAY